MTIHVGKDLARAALVAALVSSVYTFGGSATLPARVRDECELQLATAMLSLARREGHLPALASEIEAALAAGMSAREIAACLDLLPHEVLALPERACAAFTLEDTDG